MGNSHDLIEFYLISFGWSFIIWCLGIAKILPLSGITLVALGGTGPLVASLYYLSTAGHKKRNDYFYRCRITRDGLWLFAFLAPILIAVTSALIQTGLEGELGIPLNANFRTGGLGYAVLLLFFGPLPEELAWRNVGLKELLDITKSTHVAQSVVMLLWAAWHIPLFYIEGSYQAQLGLMSGQGILFFLNLMALSWLIGWVYIRSGNQAFMAVLLHYLVNLSGEMISFTLVGRISMFLITLVLVVVLHIYNHLDCTRSTESSRIKR